MLEGKHKCKECDKPFEWYYIVPQHFSSSSLQAHIIPKGKQSVTSVIARDENRVPTEISVWCADEECPTLNTFKVSK